jgi:membrane-bound lytic murein transglycosylase A
MPTSSKPAPSASRITSVMSLFLLSGLDFAHRVRQRLGTAVAIATVAAILGTLAGCGGKPLLGPAPPALEIPPSVQTPPPAATDSQIRTTPRGRWVRGEWSDLPGWEADQTLMAWPALQRSCDKVITATNGGNTSGRGLAAASIATGTVSFSPFAFASEWNALCREVRRLGAGPNEAQVRQLLQSRLQPWRVESAEGKPDGLMTGYFEPLLEASRVRTERHTVPVYGLPADHGLRKPWFTRGEIDTQPAAQAALKGREIAWLADPMDLLLVQIQGSGRLTFTEPGGMRRMVRLAFAGHNDQPYQSIGRWLVDQGAFTLEQASWPAIRQWARQNPQRVKEMLAVNTRYVFFREEPLADPAIGALGAQGVPLTPGRSIAVDKDSIPYGTPVWLASTEPQLWSQNPPAPRPLQRLVLAQDTGSAITGAVRADYFWGWGDGVEERAGRTKQPLKLWVLWPK